ncbi:MAG: hypothetical protein OXE99_01195 [Cellvibrionales bacterium]|nr:hypothetical protein [Cellvibrionales bacterium]
MTKYLTVAIFCLLIMINIAHSGKNQGPPPKGVGWSTFGAEMLRLFNNKLFIKQRIYPSKQDKNQIIAKLIEFNFSEAERIKIRTALEEATNPDSTNKLEFVNNKNKFDVGKLIEGINRVVTKSMSEQTSTSK